MSRFRVSKESSIESSIYTALAAYPNPKDFCRELYIGGLGHEQLLSVSIFALDPQINLRTVGSFPPSSTPEMGLWASRLEELVRDSLKSENRDCVSAFDLETEANPFISITIIPSYLTQRTNGVLVFFYEGSANATVLGRSEYLALALACDLYCSGGIDQVRKFSTELTTISGQDCEVGVLSSRQLEILSMIKEGHTNELIARKLNFSLATIKKEISTIFRILGVNNRESAAALSPSDDGAASANKEISLTV